MGKVTETLAPLWRRKKNAPQVDLEEYLEQQKARGLDGPRQISDPVPIAPPVGYKKQPSIADQIRTMVRSERLKAEVEARGQETFEEADDFEIADDPSDPQTPWENDFDPPVKDLIAEGKQALAEKNAKPPTDGPGATKPAREPVGRPLPEPAEEK